MFYLLPNQTTKMRSVKSKILLLESTYLLSKIDLKNGIQNSAINIRCGISVERDFETIVVIESIENNKLSCVEFSIAEWNNLILLKNTLLDFIRGLSDLSCRDFNSFNVNLGNEYQIKLNRNIQNEKIVHIKNVSIKNSEIKLNRNCLMNMFKISSIINVTLHSLQSLDVKKQYGYYLNAYIVKLKNDELSRKLLEVVPCSHVLRALLELLNFYEEEVKRHCKLVNLYTSSSNLHESV